MCLAAWQHLALTGKAGIESRKWAALSLRHWSGTCSFMEHVYSHFSIVNLWWNDFNPFVSFSNRPAHVIPSERTRKWCHATTTALRGTTGDPGSGETSVLQASTMEEPITAVPLPLSMATTVQGSFPSQSSRPSSQLRSQLPWQHQAAT